MKRLAAIALAVVCLTGCSSSDTEFHIRDGVCYRTRTHRTMGMQTSKSTVQAIMSNCTGLQP